MINIYTRIKLYIRQLFYEPHAPITGGKRINWLYYYKPI